MIGGSNRGSIFRGAAAERSRLLARLLLMLLGVSLLYARKVSPIYDYIGYHYFPWTFIRVIFVGLAASTPLLFLPTLVRLPSELALWILYLAAYVPGCLMPAIAFPPESNTFSQTVVMFAVGLGTLALTLKIKIPKIRVPRLLLSRTAFMALFLILAIFPLIYVLRSAQSLELDFLSHYNRRLATRELGTSIFMLGYLTEWLGSFIIPLLAGLAVHYRSLHMAGVAVVAVVALFAFDGTKSSLVLLVASAAVAWAAERPNRFQPRQLLTWLLILLLAAGLEGLVLRSNYLTDYVVRRAMVVPGFMAGCYMEFFSNNPLMLLTDVSGFRLLVPSPYDGTAASYIIGERMLGIEGLNANAGLWPNAYAELHLAGVVAFSFLAGLCLRFLDHVWIQRQDVMSFVGAAIAALIWVEIPLPASLSSAGVVFWFLLPLIGLKTNRQEKIAPSPPPSP